MSARGRLWVSSLAGAMLFSGCRRELDGVPCPCVSGWSCCQVENVCVRAGEVCPSSSRGGDAGATTSALADGGVAFGGSAAQAHGGVAFGGSAAFAGGAIAIGGNSARTEAGASSTGGVTGSAGNTAEDSIGGTAIGGTSTGETAIGGTSTGGISMGGFAAAGGGAGLAGSTNAAGGGAGLAGSTNAAGGGAGLAGSTNAAGGGAGLAGSTNAAFAGQAGAVGGLSCGDVCDACGDVLQCDGSCPVVACVDQFVSAVADVFCLITAANGWVGQTYTATKTGRLVGVAVDVGAADGSLSLRVALYDALGGLPIATLGEATVATGVSPLTQLVRFNNPVHQVAGHRYAMVVNYPDAPAASPDTHEGTWYGSSAGDYAGGEFIYSSDGTSWKQSTGISVDLRFATYVMPE